jgi:outer membrane protein insertion porin family
MIGWFAAAWLCLQVIPAAAAAADTGLPREMISNVRIEIVDPPPGETDWAGLARSLILIEAGDRFSENALRQSIAALEQSNRFRSIHVDAEESAAAGDDIVVVFKLTPFRLVKDVRIEGAYPVFERRVLNDMTVFPGDNYVATEIAEQAAAIERLFVQQGYIAPQVTLGTWQDPQDGHYLVLVDIHKDAYYRIESVEFTGNRAFSDRHLKTKMATWRWSLAPGSSGRFVEKDLKDDVKALVAFYRSKGYAEATVVETIRRDPGTATVALTLTVDEGPRYEVAFEGNAHFRDWTLKKDLVLSSEGNRNDRGLRKSLRQIRDRYRKEGFLNASVTLDDQLVETEAGPVRRVQFNIQEGSRSIVTSVDVSGNASIPAGRIEKQMLTSEPGLLEDGAYTPRKLEEDRRAIEALYLREGYPHAVIRTEASPQPESGSVAVSITIEENRQVLVKTVRIEGFPELTAEGAMDILALRPGAPFQEKLLREDEKTLSALVSEKGFPFVTASSVATFSEDQREAGVVYTIDPGPFVELGTVHVTGNFRTRAHIIQNELTLETGDPFSTQRVLSAQKDLRDMGIFSSVQLKTVGLKERREAVDLFIEVEERTPYYVEFGGGYESDRGLFVNAGTGDINFLGANKKIWLSGQVSEIGYRADAGIGEPRLLGSRVSGAFQVFTEKREEFNQPFGTRQTGASLTFNRRWWDKLTLSLRFDFDQRDQYTTGFSSENIEKRTTDEFRSRSVLSATPGIAYDTRDSFIRPRKGFFSAARVDISKGLRDDFDSFLRYRLDARYFTTPWPRLTLAILGRAGTIDPYGNELKVPDDQLFFLGGIENVRGYDENLLAFDVDGNPLGGRKMAVLSLESRIDLGRNFELTLFYDTGLVDDTYDATYDESFRSSVGVGLRYITPIGPMGLLYGRKIDPRPGESDDRWHLSIGYTF